MRINPRSPSRVVPSYSFTGDLLSFSRCMLQYRYYNQSQLPPSRPVQLWYGEFVHGVLEQAYRVHRADTQARDGFPWPYTELAWRAVPSPDLPAYDVAKLAHPVEEALRQQNKLARTRQARLAAYRRVTSVINILGPHLFPLIAAAEQNVIGTRDITGETSGLRSRIYEIHGRIDVVSNVTMSSVGETNVIRQAICAAIENLPESFEILVDYKGQRRPTRSERESDLIKHEQQLLTYAWLRERTPDSTQVAAGVLIYINELEPGGREMYFMRRNLVNGTDDVLPVPGSPDYYAISGWRLGAPVPSLSLAHRLRRAIHVVTITEEAKRRSLDWIDATVRIIEERVAREPSEANLHSTWSPTCGDPATCVACDFFTSCPSPASRRPGDDEPDFSPDDPETS